MSREILEDIINDFSPEKFSRFFREKNRAFTPRQESFAHYDDESFTSGLKIGEIQFSESEKLLVCAFKAGQPLSERSGKKAQYEKGKKILKETHSDAGIFIFYDTPGNFRFSLIYDIPKEKGRRDWSSFRRFTYFVSREFTNKTFLQRIGDGGFPSLDKIKDAFSVEKVTKEFYEAYRKLFEALVADLNKNRVFQMIAEKNQINTADFAKKLLGQIVFLYFLQKKSWLGVPQSKSWGEGDKNFISNLYKQAAANKENFFNDYLEILFYDTLNNAHREGADPSFSKHFKCRIPFLNGGLFEPEYDWRGTKIYLENNVFRDICEVFDRYNFTVEEDSPDDKEVAVDPEMLGKVFENLLEENLRKGRGTYYTPREIVHYMCQESLVNYLKTASGLDDKAIRSLVLSKTADKLTEDDSKTVDKLLADIKVCDPACGSGAFLVGMLHEIISARLLLNPGAGEYGLKKEAIQNCIYGVDIDPGAVEIAKLRLWLSLVVDYDLADIEPLPNLDYKVMCGNSLLEELIVGDQTIKLFDERLLGAKAGKKDQLFEAAVEGGQFKGGRRDYLRKALQEKQDQLMMLHGTGQLTMERKRELDREISLLNKELNPRVKKSKNHDAHPSLFQEKAGHYFEVLRKLHKRYFSEYDPDKKKAIRRQIEDIELEFIKSSIDEKVSAVEDQIRNLNMQNPEDRKKQVGLMKKKLEYLAIPGEIHRSKTRPYFLWHLNFFEVFQDKGGFDVTIGNPPYVRADEQSEWNQCQRRQILMSKQYVTLWEKWDLFVPFIERAYKLLKSNGVTTLIVSDAFCHSKYAQKSQTWFLANGLILRLDFCSDLQIFDAAVHNLIYFFQRADGARSIPERRVHRQMFGNILKLPSDEQDKLTYRAFFPEYAKRQSFVSKTLTLDEICYISYGLRPNSDENEAKGEFTTTDVVSETRDRVHCRPYVEGKHLGPWLPLKNLWIEWGTERAPSRFCRPTFPELYTVSEKILSQRSPGPDPIIAYDNRKLVFTPASVGFVPWHALESVRNNSLKKAARYHDEKPQRPDLPRREKLEQTSHRFSVKYLLGIMNSTIACNFLRANRRSNIHLYPDDWKKLPIPDVPPEKQNPIITLVNQILEAKRRNREADIGALEQRINQIVYKLYGLSEEEIKIVEGANPDERNSGSRKPRKSKSRLEKVRST